MTFESLILDIDGTLWDSRALVAEGWNAQLRQEGYADLCVNVQSLTALFGKTQQELADIMLAAVPQAERMPLMDRCMEREQQHLREDPCKVGYPGVRETLEQLSRKHRLFIVSNCSSGYPELCMEKLGISHLICGHLCYGDTRTCKGETIRKLMETHGIGSACYIGDTQGDANAAALAGIPFVYCAYGFGNVEVYWKKLDRFEDLLTL